MFAQAGAKVVFNYQSAKTQAEALAQECGRANCHAVQCELSTPAAAGELVAATVAKFGRLDIVIANHGIWPPTEN